MKNEEFLDYMKHVVDGWKNAAQTEALKKQYEGFLVTIEPFRDNARHYDSAKKTMHDLLLEFSKGALRALLLVNTGGIFVVMTIVSAMLAKDSPFKTVIPSVVCDAQYFVYGVTFAVATVLLSYLTQWLHNNVGVLWVGYSANIVAIFVGSLSFAAFVRGAFALMCSLSSGEIVCAIYR